MSGAWSIGPVGLGLFSCGFSGYFLRVIGIIQMTYGIDSRISGRVEDSHEERGHGAAGYDSFFAERSQEYSDRSSEAGDRYVG